MDKNHATLTYTHIGLVDAILTPVELFSDFYDEVNGVSMAEVAVISIRFPNGAVIEDVRVAICSMSPENEMIIGMDIITKMDIAITNGGGQTQLSFAIPPFENRIDFTNFTNR